MNEIKKALIMQMTEIAKKNVKFYFDDFTAYDIPSIVEAENLGAVWFIRESGTNLLWDTLSYMDFNMYMTLLDAYCTYNDRAFRIKSDGSIAELDIEMLKPNI